MVRTQSQRIRHTAKGRLAIKTAKVRERIFGLLGYDAELPVRECQFEGLDIRSRELEYARYFYEVSFVFSGVDKKLSEDDKRLKRAKDSRSRRWQYNSVVRGKLDSTANSHSDTEEYVFKMGRLSVNEVTTSGRTNESDNEGEEGLEQFPSFPSQLVSYPPGSDAFREFCKAKAAVGGKWGKYVEFVEYGLSLLLTNLAKGIMNTIKACPVQMNGNIWDVIIVCDHLNKGWEKEEKVRRITPEDVLQFYEGNCLQRDDEEPLNLRFRSVKQSVKSTVERKESLLDEVAEEETELKLVFEGLGLSKIKRVDSKSNKVRKAQSTRSMVGVDEGKRPVSGEGARTNLSKTPRTGSLAQPNPVKSSKVAQLFPKKRMLKSLPASGTTESGEVAKDKRRVEPLGESGEKVAEGRSASVDDLKEVEERARLAILQREEDTCQMVACLIKGMWLSIEEEKSKLKKAKSELKKDLTRAKTEAMKEVKKLKASHVEEVDVIKANTYVEVEDEEAEVVGVVDGLYGVSRQTVLNNQGDDVELPEGGSEKVVREMSLRINDLESGLAREKETSKALLSAQMELQVELDSSRTREDNVLMCNQKFAEQFDRMKEANENTEDQYVKAHFRLEKLNQANFDLTLQVEEKDSEIKKGLEELFEAIECAEKLQRQVSALAAKGKQVDTAQYRIQALEQTEERFRSDLQRCRNDLECMRQKFVEKDDELRVARDNLLASEAAVEHLKTCLPAKDMEF
ncbi:hypothetical protein GIB67_024969 [Kingdonia uniflora]|uniref:Uncharacterized protein n=1 Tax=Kingdonia uniflora TaxID=39325 RepID=A0A7J7NYV3_9MAGN|nr:hypothetical protein GIB67_024969 [Kingdonia uniflora]